VVHVIRGDKAQAIESLRDAIDDDWRDTWWRLRAPIFDSMLDEPEWNELIEQLDREADEQWQWYLDHKDEPLT